jgi:exodeoxyribonuclease-3
MLKLCSWNVNGIRAAQKKGFLDWLDATQPDMVAIQETKAHPDQLDDALKSPPGYQTYFAWSTVKKGYSGVAFYTKIEPNDLYIGLGIEDFDQEGRTFIAEYDDFVLIGAYFPNGGQQNERVPFKMRYKAAFLEHCEALRADGKSIIFCGDVNTAHRPVDLANPKANEGNTGFLPEERAWIDEVVAAGYIDIWRDLHPDAADTYTYWTYWGNARPRNTGWRIDYFFISPDMRPRVIDAAIHTDVMGSDHCPVSLTVEG